MDQLLQRIWIFFQRDRGVPHEIQLFRLICLTTTLLILLFVYPLQLLQDLPPALDLLVPLFGFFSFYCYRSSLRGKHHIRLFYLFALLLINCGWLLSGGTAGSAGFYFFTLIPFALSFFRGHTRWLMILLILANCLALLWVEYGFPHLVTQFTTPRARHIDLLTGYIFSGTICTMLYWLVLNRHQCELAERLLTEEGLVRAKGDAEEKQLSLERILVEYKRVEEELTLYQGELEERVSLRTDQLGSIIEELQQEIRTRRSIEKDLRHSKESLQLAIESTDLGTLDYHPPSGRLACSAVTNRHLRLPEDTTPDRHLFLQAIHPDDRQRVRRSFEAALRYGSGGEFIEEFRVGLEEDQGWLSARAQVFYNEMGEAVRLIGITRDISREKRAEEMILRLNRLHAVLSAINQAIVHSSDRQTIFHEFCRVAVELGGFRLAKVGLVTEDGMVEVAASCGATDYLEGIRISTRGPEGMGPTGLAIRTGSYYVCNDFSNALITRPWHERAAANGLRSAASIAIKENGKVIGVLSLYAGEVNFFDSQQIELLQQMGSDVSFALDILEREQRRQKAEQALQRETAERLGMLERLRTKEQLLIQQSRQAAMGEMIGNIAHQWRQPLNTLGLTVQQMKLFYDMGEFSGAFLEEEVGRAMELIQHMSQTIDDFRNYFKPDKEKVPFSVHEAVSRALSLISPSLQNRGIEIEINAVTNPIVIGYPNEYSQALLNILINARDALLAAGEAAPSIRICIDEAHDDSMVTITDNGGGIPEEIIEKIFDPYFTTKGPQTGTGIGLFMSKAIIEKNMGGKLSVRNVSGGAEFRIEMPLSDKLHDTTRFYSSTLHAPPA